MDRIIEIKVNGSYLTKDNAYAGVQYEGNAKTLRIEFDEGWDGYAKTVTFWNALGENPVKRTLTADLLEDLPHNTRIYLCKIPGEAMTEAGLCTFVIDGYANGARQRSVADKLKVRAADFEEEAGEPTDPTPSQAEQLQVQIDTLLQDISAEADRAETAKEGADAARDQAEKFAGWAEAQYNNAAMSAHNAKKSEEAAAGYATDAAGSASEAEGHAADAAEHASEASMSMDDARISEHNAEVYAEGGTPEAHPGQIVLQGIIPGAKGYMDQAAESAQQASSQRFRASMYAVNAEAYSEGGIPQRDVGGGTFMDDMPTLGSKGYAAQAQVYTEGGEAPMTPPQFGNEVLISDGAKNFADRAAAFAVGGDYREYYRGGTWKTFRVEKGAMQYAEETARIKDETDGVADEVKTAKENADNAAARADAGAKSALAYADEATRQMALAAQHQLVAEEFSNNSKAYAEGGTPVEYLGGTSFKRLNPVPGGKYYMEQAQASAEDAAQNAQRVNPEKLAADISAKADNLEFDSETNLLWLTSGGERIGDGIKVATSGGGGGGGSESNNAVMTLKNTTGWTYKSMGMGAACPISFEWSSIEENMETGNGVLKIYVGTSVKHTVQITQGAKTIDISPYLGAGDSTVKVNVTDVYGNSRSIMFNLTVVELTLTSTFDADTVRTGAFNFPYTPTAALTKTMHIKVDGTELTPVTVNTSGREMSYTIPAQSHGSHTIEAWFTAKVNDDDAESNRLYYTIICAEAGNNTPIIAVDWRTFTVEQFATLAIPYRVYDPASLTAQVSLHSSETGESTPLTVDRTKQTWSYRPETIGALSLSFACVGADMAAAAASVTLSLTVTETNIDVNAETENLSLHLTSYGRSNREENPNHWSYGNVAATLSNFNFTSDGWMEDEDGITVLRVGGDARVEIPVKVFEEDFRTTGKTIEIEFASRSVLDYDAILATCWTGGRGFQITAQQATLKSEKSEVTTSYKEDDHLRLSFVIEKRSGNRLIIGYVNGIISGMMQYDDSDDFSQAVPVTITLGSNDCTLDVYNIRIYENDLSRFQLLDNWIADTQNLGEKMDRYLRNDIFNDYGQILPETLRPQQCYLILSSPVLPTYKGDKKTCSGQYVDPVNTNRSFTFEGAEIDVQGTSSQFYYVKNFKIKFKGGFKMPNGETAETYAMNPNAVPTNEFTFKADVASSEGANNVVLAELYNDLCPVKTPAQKSDPRVRQTIEGHPIVVFHDDGSGPKFIGKYNFNNDKGTAEVFGFVPGDESWEIKENGNALVSFKSSDFTNWEAAFEARYPDKNTDISRLQQFVAWVASTDVTGKTGSTRTTRLNKFKNEIRNWANVEDAIFYYLFTLIFLCIDQREKNAFPTYNAELAKWLWLFYDADSSLGTDNKGNLTFEYWMEDIDFTAAGDPVFNGQNNVFWSNLRECFPDEIRDEYRRLRTQLGADGKALLSYDKVNELFTAHQSQWSEAIFNEDAWRKAVEPLEKIGDTQYLPMQQGKKEQHFKHWMYNRFRYLDSKFETGAALDDENRIMMRAHAQGNIKLTSYINMYGQVYYNSARAEHRMERDKEYEFKWLAQGAEDAVIGVNSAPMITSLGDLSPLMLEYCHIQYAKHLTELKVGNASASYVNDNFVALTLGNNTLLKKLDVRNCTALTQAVDASGCTNIEEVYFDGTKIVGLSLPNGGILKKLHLPATITDLTLRNQPKLEEFVLPSYSNITTLRLENVPACVDGWTILHQIPANSRVRMVGFDWTQASPEAVLSLYDYLDTMRGLDENGNNVAKAQMQGTIRIESLTGSQLREMQSRYPSIKIVYQNITSSLYFYDDAGSTLLYVCDCANGSDGTYGGSAPTKAPTAQYNYTFAGGWSLTPGGSANANALKAVTADRNVYAVFVPTVRTYTVYWKNGSTTLETDSNVPYGTTPTYNGSTPVYTGSGSADDYTWNGWTPAVGPITGNTTYEAKFKYTGAVYSTLLDRSISGNYVNDTLTTIGANAFVSCTLLEGVSFPNVTSTGDNVFSKCTSLTSVDLPALTSISPYTFNNCDALEEVMFKNVTSVGRNAFYACDSLRKVAFVKACTFDSFVFSYCSQFEALVLWSDTMSTLTYSDIFAGTRIASGTGYIYVPRALVNAYKADSLWGVHAAQIRAVEDYPEHWDPYSWDGVSYRIEHGDYATFYSIGNEIPLDLGSEGLINMQVAAFDTDDLADGSGKAPITFVAKELLTTKRALHPTDSERIGWASCELRSVLATTILPLIPANCRSIIAPVNKVQAVYDSAGTRSEQTTADSVWIPAHREVSGSTAYEPTGVSYNSIFGSAENRTKVLAGTSTKNAWWQRTEANGVGQALYVSNTGGVSSSSYMEKLYGICLCFCVGKKEG